MVKWKETTSNEKQKSAVRSGGRSAYWWIVIFHLITDTNRQPVVTLPKMYRRKTEMKINYSKHV